MKSRVAMLALAVLATQIGSVAQQRPVTLFVPAFEGPDSLGRNVATILNLQVWQTLRRAPFPNPTNLNFGDGLVLWGDTPLIPQDHEGAEQGARLNSADLVLWGKASRYGDGVIVQAYLTMPSSDRQRIWQVTVSTPNGQSVIGVDVPRRRYQFHPIVMTQGFIENYSTPDALKLYATPTSAEPIGVVGPEFTALEQGGRVARVRSGGTTGWLRLPTLSTNRSEIVDFIGGVIRVMRSDWNGAALLFRNVVANPQTPTALKIDAHLYRAVALERVGTDGTDEIRRAYALNQYDRVTVTYLLMSQVQAMARMASGDPLRARVASEALRILSSNQYLFPSGDPWLNTVAAFLRRP
jgi:hypothetical protein